MAPGLPAVYADPERVHQVLANLLGNAIKFTPRGGRVEVVADGGSPERVRVQVADTGPGIPREFLGRIFGKFEQAGRFRDQPGTGLGLSICKGIVELHGGTIQLRSPADPTSGRGTAFTFSLPIT
jgi:signal transduction histidine kinase